MTRRVPVQPKWRPSAPRNRRQLATSKRNNAIESFVRFGNGGVVDAGESGGRAHRLERIPLPNYKVIAVVDSITASRDGRETDLTSRSALIHHGGGEARA